MKLLLDTCVLSELRNPQSASLILAMLESFESDDLFISVISIGEITKGITLLEASKRKTELELWALSLEKQYTEHILRIDCEVVHAWGELTTHAQKKGKIIPMADGLIAATALVYGLHVMTRNVSDFEATGVLLLNPWHS